LSLIKQQPKAQSTITSTFMKMSRKKMPAVGSPKTFDEVKPPWRQLSSGGRRRNPFLHLGYKSTDHNNVMQWIENSVLPILNIKLARKKGAAQLEKLLKKLPEKLQSRDKLRIQTALLVIYELATSDLFANGIPNQLLSQLVTAILRCLRNSDPEVTRQAVHTLESLPWSNTETVRELAKYGATNPDAETARSTIALLAKLEINRRSAAVPFLSAALSHADEGVREAACDALRQMGPDSRKTIEELTKLATSDASSDVRKAATLAVLEIMGLENTVKHFQRKISVMAPFLDFLRDAGASFRALRLELEEMPNGPAKRGRPLNTARNEGWADAFQSWAKLNPNRKKTISDFADEVFEHPNLLNDKKISKSSGLKIGRSGLLKALQSGLTELEKKKK
jgi:hypothetical protein